MAAVAVAGSAPAGAVAAIIAAAATATVPAHRFLFMFPAFPWCPAWSVSSVRELAVGERNGSRHDTVSDAND
ncbi:hypothetical protein GCM10010341_59990 [Streptomyces noursei]|nr:hypothetical protein GCM10010341_59990 [Streptomyces noursei]